MKVQLVTDAVRYLSKHSVQVNDVTGNFCSTNSPTSFPMTRTLLASSVACATLLIPLSAQAASFSSLTIMGDSLLDTGNLFNVASSFGSNIPPSPPYNQRFSNGLLWIDIVQQELGLSPILSTEFAMNPDPSTATEGINFAFAGALSSIENTINRQLPPSLGLTLPGLQDQIDSYEALVLSGLPVDPTGLFTLWTGVNDYNNFFENLEAELAAGRSPSQLPGEVTDNVVGSIVKLAELGAKNILVPNLPLIGLLPFADVLNAAIPQEDIPTVLNQLSAAHNQLLSAKLDAFEAQYSDVKLIELDIETLFFDAVSNPAAFGFTNVDTPCIIDLPNGVICNNPDEFLFWDLNHPTEAAHEFVAELALEALHDPGSSGGPASTPEPGIVVGTLFAFGLTGLWRRRQLVNSGVAEKSAA